VQDANAARKDIFMTDDRGVMIQYFHWYTENDGTLWKILTKNAPELAKSGFTAV
jgi:alpha-amylase